MKILVIEDEPDVIEVVTLTFRLRWPESTVLSATEGASGLELLVSESPDLVILDLGLPDIDGFEVLKEMRAYSDVPTIILTARDAEIDKVRGLELGADDYITKPFSHLELLARVRAVLRRAQIQPLVEGEAPFQSGELSIDFAGREVHVGGKRVKLTPTEYNLLYHLVRNAGQVLEHRTLLAKVWGREYVDEVDYLKVHIQHLRQKLGDDPQSPRMILTERGVGYKFRKEG